MAYSFEFSEEDIAKAPETIETVFLPCDPQMNGISSSAVREIAAFGGDIRPFVPDELTEEIRTLLSKE